MPLDSITTEFLDEDAATSDKFPRFLRACLNDIKRTIPAGSVLQLQQILNISVPKEDRELPRSYHQGADVLKVVLSDGDIHINALLYQSSPELSMNTPPGTKIRFTKPVLVTFGTFSLSSDVYEVLGGHVTKLVEKWTLQRKINVKQEWGYNSVGVSTGGPPQWKPFGYNATAGIDVAALRKMKAMDIVNEQKEGSKQGQSKKTQFDVQRDQALEEVRDKSLKQNWCPPAKNLMDKELVDLLSEGFPLEEAEEALKKFKNPKKALQHLKDTNQVTKFREEQKSQPKEKGKWRNNRADDEDAEVPREYQRPTKSISLFGFIEQHIKPETPATKTESYGREEGMDELQLALNMSVKSYKQESQRMNSKYDGDNEFPSLHDKFARSTSDNNFQAHKGTQNRNFGNGSGQYSTNNYTKQSPRHQTEYASQRSAPTRKDYQSNSRQQETPVRHTKNSREKDSDYRQGNSSYKPTDFRRPGNDYNTRPNTSNDYSQNDSHRGNSFYRRTNESQSTGFGDGNSRNQGPNRTYNPHTMGTTVDIERSNATHSLFSNPSDVNRGRDTGSPFTEMNHFQYGGRDEDRSFNQKGKNEFRSGGSGKGGMNNYGGNESSGGASGWRNNDNKGSNDYNREYTHAGYGPPPSAKSLQPSYEPPRTYEPTHKYTDSQSKFSSEYQASRDNPRGGYDRRKDIPDRKASQYNPNPDNSAENSHNNYGYSSGNPYETTSSNFTRSYDQFQNQGRAYSNSSGPSNYQNEYLSDNTPKMEPYGSASTERSTSGYNLHGQKSQEDYFNYTQQTMVFTRSSNGGGNQQSHQKEMLQLENRVKNIDMGPNTSDPFKSYQNKSGYNNHY